MRIAIVINKSWNIYNFRMGLVKAFLKLGHEVVAIAPEDEYSQKLVLAGCRYYPIEMESKGTNPLEDLMLTKRFYDCYRQVKPDVILQYTIKPNIYGTVAARLAGIPTINNVSGLGTVFIVRNFVSKVALKLYKFAFRFPIKVFFQNKEDRQLFLDHRLIKEQITDVLPGSGIDTQRFKPAPIFTRNQQFTFLMVARVLYEKGVVEYVEAARIIKARYPEVRCQLLGGIDESGNIGIKKSVFQEWVDEGAIEYLGTSGKVETHIAEADCVVLPSYREGTPKTLLEAAAMGKPIVTTNVPGCRETVIEGQNGFLCEVRNSEDLADKMIKMYQLPVADLENMGKASRQLAEEKFDERYVIDKYLAAIQAIAKYRLKSA
ncbi:glycosyltransferase family 4 protein [Adhaeribacter rhizoryzae]|uniref:Glycosyltransferase family 4 protein n=1 Tax=Adhaeribacter rhizoryzae TaxID=2607907 RepID=A0A5M6DUQ8_9BACT|nr:glycosyltransferase family 4 protein [Adhaeribacter rhizoryzae]KAA5549185.1 glycosyltransferase family 4 protein [Adhaeribacter rhizoryzae]